MCLWMAAYKSRTLILSKYRNLRLEFLCSAFFLPTKIWDSWDQRSEESLHTCRVRWAHGLGILLHTSRYGISVSHFRHYRYSCAGLPFSGLQVGQRLECCLFDLNRRRNWPRNAFWSCRPFHRSYSDGICLTGGYSGFMYLEPRSHYSQLSFSLQLQLRSQASYVIDLHYEPYWGRDDRNQETY